MNITAIVVFGLGLVFVIMTAAGIRFTRAIIKEYEAGLLYRNGRFERRLGPGSFLLIRPWHTLRILDTRTAFLTIPGQEVLSADNVAVKVSLVVAYRIEDPAVAAHAVLDVREALYAQAQVALRLFVAESDVDKLLQRRHEAGARLLERVAPEAEKLGLKVVLVEIKDIMFPGELKNAFAASVRARNEGAAALEKARAETAAMRNLANAAGLMESHPALLTLRWIQALDGRADKAGATVIVGAPATILPTGEVKS